MADELANIPPPKPSRRVVTMEKAAAIAALLLDEKEGMTHTVESASSTVGVKATTVRELLRRYRKDECATDEDESIAAVIDDAVVEHIRRMRLFGFITAGDRNTAGVTWARWQLEIQDPLNHPRKTETAVELTGKDGGAVQVDSTLRYVVAVPPTEPEEIPDDE